MKRISFAVLIFAGLGFGQPSITILSPAGGEKWGVGSLQHIQWTSKEITNLVLFYSTDNGKTTKPMLDEALFSDSPKWGNYPWTVPDDTSSECKIIMEEYFDNLSFKSGTFSIVPVHDAIEKPAVVFSSTVRIASSPSANPLLFVTNPGPQTFSIFNSLGQKHTSIFRVGKGAFFLGRYLPAAGVYFLKTNLPGQRPLKIVLLP